MWPDSPPRLRPFERIVTVGRGEETWRAATDAVMRWEVKRRSGFVGVAADGAGTRAREKGRYVITAGVGRLVVREPVEVVAVAQTRDRRGFAYGTRHGHPLRGPSSCTGTTTAGDTRPCDP